MSGNKELFTPQGASEKYRDRVNSVLLGSSRKRDQNEKRARFQDFALLPSVEFGNKTLEELGLKVNKEVLKQQGVKAEEALRNFDEAAKELSIPEITRALEM